MKYFIISAFCILSVTGNAFAKDSVNVEVLSTQTSFVPGGKGCPNDRRYVRPSVSTECTPIKMVTQRPVNRTSLGEKIESITISDTCIAAIGGTTNVLCRMGNTLYARSLNRELLEIRKGKKPSGHGIAVGKFVGTSSVKLLPGIIPSSSCDFEYVEKTGVFSGILGKLNIRSKAVISGEHCYPKLRGLLEYTDPQTSDSANSGTPEALQPIVRTESPSVWSSPASMKTLPNEDLGSSANKPSKKVQQAN